MDQVIADRYALGDLLGTGGMARVYAARDDRLGRTVAIKLVPIADAEPVLRQRFIREARSAAGFSHPNAVAVFDAGEADGYLYLVMELVVGRSLARRLAENGRLDPAVATTIASGVLRALGAAHAVGIVHRDVKPANVLLADDGGVKLADFGIAKRLDDVTGGDVTLAGEIVGTPTYLAPEQMMGQPASPASDVYAVGVLLFEMLAGRPPFDAGTPMATALAHRVAPVPDVSAENPAVPPRLANAIRRAMAKEPADRFATARAMLDAITTGAPPATAMRPPGRGGFQPTQVMPQAGYTKSSVSRRWVVALAAALLGGAAVLGFLVVRDAEPDGADPAPSSSSASTSPSPPASTVAPTIASTAVQTTLVATTTVPVPVTTLSTVAPDSVEGAIITLQANPGGFGPRAGDVIDELGKINGNGQSSQRRAGELLDQVAGWVETGDLSPAVLTMLEPILGPIAGDDDDDDDD